MDERNWTEEEKQLMCKECIRLSEGIDTVCDNLFAIIDRFEKDEQIKIMKIVIMKLLKKTRRK